MSNKYIILCEAGWHNARELSLELCRRNIPSSVLIKGRPGKEVRGMITGHSLINNIFIPEKLFSVFLFLYIFSSIFITGELTVFFNKEKTYNMIAGLKKVFSRIRLEKVPVRK